MSCTYLHDDIVHIVTYNIAISNPEIIYKMHHLWALFPKAMVFYYFFVD